MASTLLLRGKPGACGAGLALVACLVCEGCPWRHGALRGRLGARRHQRSFCLAGVALGDIHAAFAWQPRRLWHWAASGGSLGRCSATAHLHGSCRSVRRC